MQPIARPVGTVHTLLHCTLLHQPSRPTPSILLTGICPTPPSIVGSKGSEVCSEACILFPYLSPPTFPAANP